MSRLERGYRRLLLAYPRDYRRARGDEIVTTLMEGAAPDRALPPAGEAWDLLRGGLRQRFAPPHGRHYSVVAVLSAVAIAYVTLSLATRLTTEGDVGVKTVLDAATLLEPQDGVQGGAQRQWTTFGGPVEVDVRYPARPEALGDLTADMRANAIAQGWMASPVGPGHRFTLERAGERLVVTVAAGDPDATGGATFVARYPWPAPLLPAGIASAVLGGLAGWLGGAWTLRRFRSRAPAGRLAIALVGTTSLVLIGAAGIGAAATTWESLGVTILTASLGERLGLIGIATTLAFAAFLPAAGAPAGPPLDVLRAGVRVVAAVHLAFGAAIATVLATFTARMLTAGADRAAMLSGAHDPKDLLPLPVFVPVALLYYSGVILSPLLLTVSVPLLSAGRERVGAGTWNTLLVAAISAVALPALMFTPYGADAGRWWLD